MKRAPIFMFVVGFIIILSSQLAASRPVPQQEAVVQKQRDAPTDQASRGERAFKQNCARCHNAPQGFPSQISGTIVRHMRVRASLSEADEKAILHFLNP